MRKLDRTDIGILNSLQENARITNADLARWSVKPLSWPVWARPTKYRPPPCIRPWHKAVIFPGPRQA